MTFARAARTREIFRRCRGGVNGREFMIKYKLYEAYAKLSLKKYRPIAARNEDAKVSIGLL